MGRPKSYDRDDVLAKSMELFWAKGFEGTHLAELVSVTGVNRFGLYSEFGGKEGLFQSALELYLREALSEYHRSLEVQPFGLENIRSYFRSMTYGESYHGCFLINTLTEKHIVTEAAFRAAADVLLEVDALFLRNLQAAQADGTIPPDKNVKILANLLSTLDNGLAIRGIASPDEAVKNDLVEEAIGMLAGAVR